MLRLDLAVGRLLLLGPLKGLELRLGEDQALLRDLRREGFHPLVEGLQVVAQPDAAHAARGDEQLLLLQLVRGAELPEGGLLEGHLHDRLLDALVHAVLQDGSYLTQDTLGSTRAVTGQDQVVKVRHDYLPFGEEIASNVGGRDTAAAPGYNAGAVRQKFASKERDIETGLDYLGARYYSSAQGRFMGVDPIFLKKERLSDPQRLNLYAYVRNDPLKYIDPTGEDLTITVTNIVVGTSTVRSRTASEIREAERRKQKPNVSTETVNTYKVIVTMRLVKHVYSR